MAENILVAATTMHVVHDRSRNLDKFSDFIKQATQENVRLLVLPEGSLQGFIFHTRGTLNPEESRYHQENAETVPGPSTELIGQWARQANLYVVFGMFERARATIYNTAVLLGPDGYIGKYRKVHQPSEELPYYEPGQTWNSFETAIGHLGLMICYDQCFPESARELALRGAEMLVIPNAWATITEVSEHRYDLYARARAAENRCWVIQSNQVGACGDLEYLGNSRIIDPDGHVIASTKPGTEGLAIASIMRPSDDRAKSPSHEYLRQRKPGTYAALRDSGVDL